jgi:HAD superfamily phosphoserine phosphatase-like hydrolase
MEIADAQKHSGGLEFIESVLGISPGVAAFDCDGTMWSSDAGETFLDWEIGRGIVSEAVGRAMRARYADYKAGKVGEVAMCGEMVTMHRGLSDAVLMEAASEFMANSFPGKIFPEIRDLVHRLNERGCDVWAVSSSNDWVIRVAMKQFGIAEDHILATKPVLLDGIVTDQLVRIPSAASKERALREVVRKDIDAAFGNSRWDTEMLAMAKHAFAVNPTAELQATAGQRGWTIYFPGGTQIR